MSVGSSISSLHSGPEQPLHAQPAAGLQDHVTVPTAPRRPALAVVDGWPLNLSSRGHALRCLAEDIRNDRGAVLCCMNLDHLVKLRTDSKFRKMYASADYVMADGAPVAMLARRQNSAVQRSPGPDLMVPLCQQAARAAVPIFMFGTSEDVLRRGAAELKRQAPGLDIRGIEAPPYGYDPESLQADADADRIAASGARIVLLGLGSPKQEFFAARAIKRHPHLVFICIGAALDFLVGEQARAPAVMRNNGLEWLYRLVTNPKRLGKRYFDCALLLGDIVVFGNQRRSPGPSSSGPRG